MVQTERSETSAYKIQTPENDPQDSIQHLERGECLKWRNKYYNIQANKIPVCVCVCVSVCLCVWVCVCVCVCNDFN